ncbi:MAG: ATP synthase F1 subunit gamma [Deltaproteobacteria bacterium]|nr:ATP synthase F1 subunit gamma [Deltaproteobacteria bacterium]
MQNLKALRKRIVSVKKTQQITKAMKMIAAVRLRRAQEQIFAARPYSRALRRVMSSVAMRAKSKDHPLLARRPQKRIHLFVVSSHRGLCGSFNSNIIKTALDFSQKQEKEAEITWSFAGHKGHDFFQRRGVAAANNFSTAVPDVNFSTAAEISKIFETAFLAEKIDAVYSIYNEFKSAMSQGVVCEPLLPIGSGHLPEDVSAVDYICEPTKEEILSDLLVKHLRVQVYQILLESVASEHGARMTAMDSATNNAKEMIRSLTLQYNRTRQASITKELIEIVSGAEALRG